MSKSRFDPLTTNAVDLRQMLESGHITSVQIVEQYLQQIKAHDHILHAMISIAPRESLLSIASRLDDERREGKLRSPLHGIPIVLKDCFITSSELGMTTCAGAVAFVNSKASKNAAIVQRLIDAGLIILAKCNMTEFAGMKTLKMMPGWSAHGGQTISPYVGAIKENERLLGHSAPGGSSTGSAVAVAAGFSPLATATETIGSIVTPSVRAALYALKPTVGVQDTTGMYRMTEFYDSAGFMAKCAADIISLSQILLQHVQQSPVEKTWDTVSVGFLDPDKWKMDESMCEQFDGTAEQLKEEYVAEISRIKREGCVVKYPVDIDDLDALNVDGKSVIHPIAYHDFKNIGIPQFVAGFDECPVTSLEDIIQFNREHSSEAMPEPYTDQEELIKANMSHDTFEDISIMKQKLRSKGKAIINEVLERENVRMIGAPGDSSLCIHAAAAGFPHVTVPLGQLTFNGRPFGMCIVAREYDEDMLLRFIAAYERMSKPRATPTL